MIKLPQLPADRNTDEHIARIIHQPGTPLKYTLIVNDAINALRIYCNTHRAGWKVGQHEHRAVMKRADYFCQIIGGNLAYQTPSLITSEEADSLPLAICRTIIASHQIQNQE